MSFLVGVLFRAVAYAALPVALGFYAFESVCAALPVSM